MINGMRQIEIEGTPLLLTAETGALIIHTPSTKHWTGASVDLFAGAGSYDFWDKQRAPVAAHRINGMIVSAAIFPALVPGPYRAFATGRHRQLTHLVILVGEVITIFWG